MEYSSSHGHGESNFSSPLSHRMPTVSAAQALENLESSLTRCVSTSLRTLDDFLQNKTSAVVDGKTQYGGVSRGRVTEVYGPPGVGKTSLCMQLAASALRAGEGVLWVDASHPLCGTRLNQILTFYPLDTGQSEKSNISPLPLLEHFSHVSTPTLAHFIAIVSDPTPRYAVENISLIIVDSFSTLINSAFPRSSDTFATPKNPRASNPSVRKFATLQYIITALQKIAATQHLAIVVASHCVTKMRPEDGAILVPSVNTTAWEQGLGCRVALYRDWGWDDENGNSVDGVRVAQVIKAEGINLAERKVMLVGFVIDMGGLRQLKSPSAAKFEPSYFTTAVADGDAMISALPQKRKLAATDLEVPDSDEEDDEDYGWAEEDEQELPPPPPQWQGSEDALTPANRHMEADEDDLEEDNEGQTVRHQHAAAADLSKNLNGVIEDSEDELA